MSNPLLDADPSWKSIPTPPTRLSRSSSGGEVPRSARIEETVTSNIPDASSDDGGMTPPAAIEFYCYKDGTVGKIKLSAGSFTPLE